MLEWAKLIVTLGTFAVTTYIAVWKWAKQREAERAQHEAEQEERRKKLAALYVNPFLLACQELQSRLYNIIEQNGLEVLRDHYPDGTYADETIYLMAQYFGWEGIIYRYSRYARDQEVIRLTESIRDSFAMNELGIGAFCFFRIEQKSLGQAVIRQRQGQYGSEFETVSFLEFRRLLNSSDIPGDSAIHSTVEALRGARTVQDLGKEARIRLARIQSHLVKLLKYVESKEGITLFFLEGRPADRLMARENPA